MRIVPECWTCSKTGHGRNFPVSGRGRRRESTDEVRVVARPGNFHYRVISFFRLRIFLFRERGDRLSRARGAVRRCVCTRAAPLTDQSSENHKECDSCGPVAAELDCSATGTC